ncbi:G-protein coupled receptor 55 [Chanos chanos]|uniref:G-protein coupled receptor 55 n=1 Tax=Chanos chanos TaxID=29144 RepID=A0A6J2V9X1_CHACN|nr:G-protein coupled receptor 55-like [Chanos chanos]
MQIFHKIVYIPVFCLGFILNLSALVVFIRRGRWTNMHIYMMNLLVADSALIFFLPFRILDAYCPLKETILCTFLLSVHYVNMYASVYTVTAISVHRFVSVKFPFKTRANRSNKSVACIVCIFIWIAIVSVCSAFNGELQPDELQTCYERRQKPLKIEFFLILQVVGFLIPLSIIVICSIQTICVILGSNDDITEKEAKTERKRIVAVITANLVVFIVCFTPVHVAFLLKYIHSQDATSCNFADDHPYLHIFHEVSEWVATTSCCLDFFGYYFLLRRVFRVQN